MKTNENLTAGTVNKEMEYLIAVTAQQARVLSQGVDLLARVLRGQWYFVTEAIATRIPDNEDTAQLHSLLNVDDDMMRAMGKPIERHVHDILVKEPYRRDPKLPYEISCIAYDLHETIRFQLWHDEPAPYPMSVHQNKGVKWSATQPLATITRVPTVKDGEETTETV